MPHHQWVRLPDLAPALYEAGLRHLNISLDTLRRERYQEITGQDNWREVMNGLKLALALGFQPLKINCVVLRGLNDDELMDLALRPDYMAQDAGPLYRTDAHCFQEMVAPAFSCP